MSEFREISFVGAELTPFILIPAAVGGAAAGIAGRPKLAFALLGVALAAIVIPIILAVSVVLTDPTID